VARAGRVCDLALYEDLRDGVTDYCGAVYLNKFDQGLAVH
jgi:hypothetical protein